jgi:hypothetical protein
MSRFHIRAANGGVCVVKFVRCSDGVWREAETFWAFGSDPWFGNGLLQWVR